MTPARPGTTPPWYAVGIDFACQRCHGCCRSHGDYVYVYVTDDELAGMAHCLKTTPAKFAAQYCSWDEEDRILKFETQNCPLHDGTGCRVYAARPVQCRTWPFWPDNLRDRETWDREVATFCPGIGKGPTKNREEINHLAAQVAASEGMDWPE